MTDSTAKWHQFLSHQGAKWEDNELIGFDGQDEAGQLRLIPLEHQAILSVSGPDAEKFLQGQTTCDMRRVRSGNVQLGAHCDHKGRMHSSFTAAGLVQTGETDAAIGLRLHKSIAESARLALQKYIVFSKAELKLATGLHAVALLGNGAQEALQPLDCEIPGQNGTFTLAQGLTLLRHNQEHYELWITADQSESVWQKLVASAVPAAPSVWDLNQIYQGYGQVRTQTVGEFIPQMLNFQKLGGISFDKGCYTGQEVVARMHYLGKLKKHMYLAEADTTVELAPNTPLYAGGENQVLGQVVMAATDAPHRAALLFVSSEQTAARDDLTLASPDGPKIKVSPLPYSLE